MFIWDCLNFTLMLKDSLQIQGSWLVKFFLQHFEYVNPFPSVLQVPNEKSANNLTRNRLSVTTHLSLAAFKILFLWLSKFWLYCAPEGIILSLSSLKLVEPLGCLYPCISQNMGNSQELSLQIISPSLSLFFLELSQ